MKFFYEQQKKICILAAVILGTVIFAIYIYALFLPGYHHWDGFLFEQKDGSFAGNGDYAAYYANIKRFENSATITFSVDDLVHEYQITGTDTGNDVYIYKDGKLTFHGYALSTDSDYWLMEKEDSEFLDESLNNILITGANQPPDPESLFPSKDWLYTRAVSEKTDIFGEPLYLIPIIFFMIYLVIDIRFPKFFFYLRLGLMVDGGEPSDWYYSSQILGRIIFIIAIPVIMLISLFG